MALLLCAGGCATVTVQPASLTASFVSEDSELTSAAKAFKDQASDEDWMDEVNPIAFVQTQLFGMEPDKEAEPDYLEKLKAETGTSSAFRTQLIADIQLATSSLSDLNTLAQTVLDGEEKPERADVASFEEALVTAQKTHKTFSRAADELAVQSSPAMTPVQKALDTYSREIETTRGLADELVGQWRGEDETVS